MVRTNKLLSSGLVCAALLCTALFGAVTIQPAAAHAAEKGAKGKAEHRGKVTAVDTTGNTITIEHHKKPVHTFTVPAGTKISVDGVSGKTLADVTVGMHAEIEGAKKATTALSIEATTKKHKKK